MRARPSPAPPLLALLVLALAACAWSVPADPGLNAAERADAAAAPAAAEPAVTSSRAPAAADDPEARAIYLQRCSRCHEPFSPTHLSAAQWPIYVARYAPRAGLYGAERERVLRWLQANAR